MYEHCFSNTEYGKRQFLYICACTFQQSPNSMCFAVPVFILKMSEAKNAEVSCSRACIQLGKSIADITSHQDDFRIQTANSVYQFCKVKMSPSAGFLESYLAHSYTFPYSTPKEQCFKTPKILFKLNAIVTQLIQSCAIWCFSGIELCQQFKCKIVLIGTNDFVQEILNTYN